MMTPPFTDADRAYRNMLSALQIGIAQISKLLIAESDGHPILSDIDRENVIKTLDDLIEIRSRFN